MKIKNNFEELLIVVGALILLFYSHDPIFYPDSTRYLNMSILDPPFYSTVIYIMNSIFGSLTSLVILQTGLIVFSIIFFTRTLTIHFNLDNLTKLFVIFFLFLPAIKFYNSIITEPFAYAFSILFVSFITKLIFNFSNQNLIWSTILTIILLLTRNQFLFLYPLIIIVYIGVLILGKNVKIFYLLVASLFSIFIIHNSLIFLNSSLKKNIFFDEHKSASKFETLSFVNQGPFNFIFFDAIYISTIKDIELFDNQNLQKTLVYIFKTLDERKCLSEYYNSRGHYALCLRQIKYTSDRLISGLAINEDTSVVKLKKKISLKLINANFNKYIKHIFKKFYDTTWLFIFLPFLILLTGLISLIKQKSRLSLICIFFSTFALANHSVVYLFGRVQPRYLIYTDIILLVFIFVLLNFFFQKKD